MRRPRRVGRDKGDYSAARSQKIFWRNQARAGREGKGVWGKGIPAPPERKISEISVGIFAEKSSDFVQDRQPTCKVLMVWQKNY